MQATQWTMVNLLTTSLGLYFYVNAFTNGCLLVPLALWQDRMA